MRRKKLAWQLFPTYLIINLISLFAVGWLAGKTIKHYHLENRARELSARAGVLELITTQYFDPLEPTKLDSIAKSYGKVTETRITFISPAGRVLGDSDSPVERLANHADRPEFRQAISRETTSKIKRRSPSLDQDMMYLAIPVMSENKPLGVIRVAFSLSEIEQSINEINRGVAISSLVVAFLMALISLYASHRISQPLINMQNSAERFARGDFSHKIHLPKIEEMAILANTLNKMADELNSRIIYITRHRNELQALFSGMQEGVIALDINERITHFNRAALDILGIEIDPFGMKLLEVIRNVQLQNFIDELINKRVSQEEEISIQNGQRFLQVHGTVLNDEQGDFTGVLIVLSDITKLKKLENLRREFVANVSHELRTPITSIIASIETLKENAINDPEDANRFLNIIERHANRLNIIIDDLLTLSKIEQSESQKEIILDDYSAQEILKSALNYCQNKAKSYQKIIQVVNSDDYSIHVNAQLIEQALINLIENAIVYSENSPTIEIGFESKKDDFILFVRDFGKGIAPEHLPRIFERFYRVESDRSRQSGGSGLGLSIVKHIAKIHGGEVSVSSRVGKGSKFRIHLPLKQS